MTLQHIRPRAGMPALALLTLGALAACGSAPDDAPGGGARATETVVMAADYPVYLTARELDEVADTVVRGIVRSSETGFERLVLDTSSDDPQLNPLAGLSEDEIDAYLARNDGYVATTHSLEVTEVLQGDVGVGDTVTVQQIGGTHDGVSYVVLGIEQLSVGREYLLVTTAREGGRLELVSSGQSVFTVGADGALAPLATNPGGYVLRGTLAEAREVFPG
ncbi:hypothetical protein [Sanguibacter sp. HDW7]|uniref:hypothetical protein n=1 Tax=Sanguibacter sp. HDW7 TaxID=2714931 RepID=UPI00140D1F43|nr:hypothetical protein [Sanguibacter sp. HDW7]QIK84556.1 hypothetical protein G7063_13730 [Sanguibacter sp. HDW7]